MPKKLIMSALFLLFAFTATGAPVADLPPLLKPWVPWILQKHPDLTCPRMYDSYEIVTCSFASRLQLNVGKERATFELNWDLYADSWVTLPGGTGNWPIEVMDGGLPAPVSDRDNLPKLYLTKGRHVITGAFLWTARPNAVAIPPETALVSLILDGKNVAHLNIDSSGMLWFGDADLTEESKKIEDTVSLKVFRKLSDGVPLTIESVVQFSVSGRDRELSLGRFLPADSVPFSFTSELPARIERDGSLRIQARAGKWTVKLSSRMEGPVSKLKMEKQSPEWPAQELWVFQDDKYLRDVTIRGANTLDASQSDMPEEWRGLPAYLVALESVFELVEEHRGESAGTPDTIDLHRYLWLGFNDDSLLIKDIFEGDLAHDRRLSVLDGVSLGNLSLGMKPQLITSLAGERQGLELRAGHAHVEAVSTMTPFRSTIPAVGWDVEVKSASIELNLPPGLSIFHIFGADSVNNTWIEKWTVWDLFLLFLIAVFAARLLGVGWALITLGTVAIMYHEPDAPFLLLLNLLFILAFRGLVNDEKMPRIGLFSRWYLYLSALVLVLATLPFAVDQVRQGIHPQLERSQAINANGQYSNIYRNKYAEETSSGFAKMILAEPQEEQIQMAEKKAMLRKSLGEEGRVARARSGVMGALSSGAAAPAAPLKEEPYNAADKVQTGPAIPSWEWNKVFITLNGPIKPERTLTILTIPLWVNKLLSFLRAILMFLLIYKLYRFFLQKPFLPSRMSVLPATPLFLLLLFLLPMAVHGADGETEDPPVEPLLAELEQRMTAPPPCYPDCATMARGTVRIEAEQLRMEFMIDTLDRTTVRLPGNRAGWYPKEIRVNGAAAQAVGYQSEDNLLIVLPSGRNKVELSGPVRGDSFQIRFPLTAHNLVAVAPGWSFSGILKGELSEETLQCDRTLREEEKSVGAEKTLLPDPIEPFVEITRTLFLRNEWEIETTVTRVAPESGVIAVEIPLLEDESVTTNNIVVEKRRAKVLLGISEGSVSWRSNIKIRNTITLTASEKLLWSETWRLDAASKWHVEESGVPRIRFDARMRDVVPTWMPLPGEKLTFTISRPEAVAGSTKTISRAWIDHQPNNHAATTKLDLSVTSSLGDKFSLTLPEKVTVREIRVDGEEQTIQQEKRDLKLSLRPGEQTVSITFEDSEGISFFTRTPAVLFEDPLSNIDVLFKVPPERWVLFVGGPAIGPALLIWGVIIVLLCLAIALGRFTHLPLRTRHWILLFLGLCTVQNLGGIFVVAWFFVMEKRARFAGGLTDSQFNIMQVGIVALTIAAVGSLVATIPISLLSSPDMQVIGNMSDNMKLFWYQDRATGMLPQAYVISLPIWVYRAVMLAWALWLAVVVPRWLRWGWNGFIVDGVWKNAISVVEDKKPQKTITEKETEK